MHRDLKPQNILVTKWDNKTDIPTIKLAAIGREHMTFCGSEGYIAPEAEKVNKRAKKLERKRDQGMKTVERNGLLVYTNAVDIWALGKILKELVELVPSSMSLHIEPALGLISRMMKEDYKKRPTAAKCLEDPSMAINDSSKSPLAKKRGRSPTPSTSSPEQPLQKVIRRAFRYSITTSESSTATTEGSTVILMNSIWQNEGSDGSSQALGDVEMKDRSSVEKRQILDDCPEAIQLTIQLGEEGRLSLTCHSLDDGLTLDSLVAHDESIPPAILADSVGSQGESYSMQDVARRLLVALQAEGYGKNVTVAGNSTNVGSVRSELSRLSISSLKVRQEAKSSIMVGVEFDNDEWSSNFWDRVQSPVECNIGPQSADPAEENAAAAGNASTTRSSLQVLFSQACSSSVLDESWFQPEPVVSLDQITPNDSATTNTTSILTSIGSDSSSSSQVDKGITYPSKYDDIMAGIPF
jgi:serine/threonine protein kinase